MTTAAERVAQDLSEDFQKILTEIQQRKENRRKQCFLFNTIPFLFLPFPIVDILEKACRTSPEIEEMRDLLAREREEKQKQFKELTSLQASVWIELQEKMNVFLAFVYYLFFFVFVFVLSACISARERESRGDRRTIIPTIGRDMLEDTWQLILFISFSHSHHFTQSSFHLRVIIL